MPSNNVANVFGSFRGFAEREQEILNEAAHILDTRLALPHSYSPGSPEGSKALAVTLLAPLQEEQVLAMFVGKGENVIETYQVSKGTIDTSAAYPREIIKRALAVNAFGVILAHNHPLADDPEPSEPDKKVTLRIRKALGLLELELFDHFVISGTGKVYSMLENGDLREGHSLLDHLISKLGANPVEFLHARKRWRENDVLNSVIGVLALTGIAMTGFALLFGSGV